MGVKNSQRFAEIERLMSDYFSCHLAPVMGTVRKELSKKQTDEMIAYSNSTAYMLRSLASANMPGDDSYATLRITGKWNSKTTEDYLAMCKKAILSDKDLQRDLAVMAGEWRKAVVSEVGRERYDTLSRQLGCDLAYAYVDYRVEQLMIDKLVKDRMPKSSVDYIISKAAQSSLFCLPYELNKSPLTAEIEARGEAAYNPSRAEKAAGWVAGAAADAAATGGISSWATFAKFVGIDVVFNATMDRLSRKGGGQEVSVEDCISKGVFGAGNDVFASFRKQAKGISNHENAYIKGIDKQFKKKIPTQKYSFMDWMEPQQPSFPWGKGTLLDPQAKEAAQRKGKYKDVPLIVAAGKEDEYLETKARQKTESGKDSDKMEETEGLQETQGTQEEENASNAQSSEPAAQTNESGWEGLLESFGLNGFSDIGKNLGYVLAMLPDILVGLFTGKTKSLGMDNSMLPLASIVAGMFVRNPILKMLLMGMGGANLLNKAGHEVLDRKQQEGIPSPDIRNASYGTQYRRYADEPLNPRISNPVLQGRCLVASIDNVPCTVQLPDTVIEAYRSGALPLNTLANAILAKNDRMRQMEALQYENMDAGTRGLSKVVALESDANERETVTRPRGIQ